MSQTARRELEALVHERAEAVESRASDRLLAQIDADVLDYDVLPPTMSRGREAAKGALEAWFALYSDGPHYVPQLQQVDVDGDLGSVAYFYHVTGTLISGDEMDMWVRSTLVCRRGESGWQVVHAHESVPFDVDTGQALISEAPPDDEEPRP